MNQSTSRGARAIVAAAFPVLALACGDPGQKPPYGQLLLYLDTDAPLPAPAGATLGPSDSPPLFDRARIEVFAPDATATCAGCTHEFDLDRAIVNDQRASIGVTLPTGVAGWRARVRLYRSTLAIGGEPSADGTIESVVALPATPFEGIVPITVVLHTDDLANPRGTLAAPIDPVRDVPRGLAGTWPDALPRDCAGAPQDGEVCVRGGAFWMGDPTFGMQLRIATVAPFYLDATEMTVAGLRALGVATAQDPMVYDAEDGAPGPLLHCTYTADAAFDEALPVNCISHDTARRACQAKGGDLPTQAQLSYAAGALVADRFVWGTDIPSCDDAVFARAVVDPDTRCAGGWLSPPGQGARDKLMLPGGTIFDLAGNVSEYAVDRFNTPASACWTTGIARDPVCTQPIAEGQFAGTYSIVGGSWLDVAGALASSLYGPSYNFQAAASKGKAGSLLAYEVTATGFRCARTP